MYTQIDIGISDINNNETYEYIFNSSYYNINNFILKLDSPELDLYDMDMGFDNSNIIYENTNFNLNINVVPYNDDIRYLKYLKNYTYDIKIIKYKYENVYKFIGIEFNNNKYYIYKQYINKYQTILNEIDKLIISEIVIKSFVYYLTQKCKQLWYINPRIMDLFNAYEQIYQKTKIINNKFDIEYLNLYQSIILKYTIYSLDIPSILIFLNLLTY